MRTLQPLSVLALVGFFAGCGDHESATSPSKLRVPELPPVPPIASLPGDPVSPAALQLGNALFFDRRLSGSGRTNCTGCHVFNTAFQDNLPLSSPDRSHPADEPLLHRNTTSFVNLVYAPVFRWDGSHTDINEVMVFPLAEPNMNIAQLPVGNNDMQLPPAQAALQRKMMVELPGYHSLYEEAFNVDIKTVSRETLWTLTGRALRAFATQATSMDSAFDRWNAGDDAAMDGSAVRGLEVFRGKGRCIACHHGPFFTDFRFHNLSVGWHGGGRRADEGRAEITHLAGDAGKFLTPTLRQVYDSSPYFHDGSAPSLRDVLKHLASPAVVADPNHDPLFSAPISLSEGDVDDLIAFMKALRGSGAPKVTPPVAFP